VRRATGVIAAGAAVMAAAWLGACGDTGRSAAQGTRAAAGCVPPRAGDHVLAIEQGRAGVLLHVPPHARAGAPLVLGLAGASQTGAGFAQATGYSRLADRKGFFVAYPTAAGSRPFWNVSGHVPGKPDDVAYLRGVIAAATRAVCGNPSKVGVTGVSNGGGMTARLACEAADVVSAAAPVAGGYSTLPECRPSRPVPLLEVHGTDDRIVPYAGKGPAKAGSVPALLAQWRRLNGCSRRAARRTPQRLITELVWRGCSAGSVVAHVRVTDAEHGWPGEDDVDGSRGFSTTRRTWAFLSSFSR
jgi:polyhydroxybutyrate depolymerase